jgi:hypothetical protein
VSRLSGNVKAAKVEISMLVISDLPYARPEMISRADSGPGGSSHWSESGIGIYRARFLLTAGQTRQSFQALEVRVCLIQYEDEYWK